MSIKKAAPKKKAPHKGLTDEEFIKKYEAGGVDLSPVLSKGMPKIEPTRSAPKEKK